MHRYRQFLRVLAGAVAATLVAVAGASASHAHAAKTTLEFFGKTTAVRFTNSSGKSVNNPGPGDHLFDSLNLYAGTAKRHATKWTGSAFAYCTITNVVSQSNVQAACDAVLAVGGSMLTSVSTQNVVAQTSVYPIDGGTGKWVKVKGGSVKTTSLGSSNSASVVVTIKP
jgi:hypothetical protein